jgi:tetratricopeptide (TPR) repeat protein
VADNPRIEELRRRVQKDPASIAFAQLAEEYRRSGNYDEAVRVCRAGLAKHPSYLSARVTLGRALIELEQFEEAQTELDYVLRSAPENLAAIRGLAEIHQRRGELGEALKQYQTALGIAKHDPELEESVNELSRQLGLTPPAVARPASMPAGSTPDSAVPPPIPFTTPPPIPLDDAMLVVEAPAPEGAKSEAETIGAVTADRKTGLDADIPLSPELEAAADEFTKALAALDSITIDLPAPPLVESVPATDRNPAAEEPVVPAQNWEVEGFDAAWNRRSEMPATQPTMPEPAASSGSPEGGALDELEEWLDAIVTNREAHARQP